MYCKADEIGTRGFLFPFLPSWQFTHSEAVKHTPSSRADVPEGDEWAERRFVAALIRKVSAEWRFCCSLVNLRLVASHHLMLRAAGRLVRACTWIQWLSPVPCCCPLGSTRHTLSARRDAAWMRWRHAWFLPHSSQRYQESVAPSFSVIVHHVVVCLPCAWQTTESEEISCGHRACVPQRHIAVQHPQDVRTVVGDVTRVPQCCAAPT